MHITFYKTANDKNPIEDFLNKLSARSRAGVVACLVSLGELGFKSPRVYFRQIKSKLWEIKIKTTDAGFKFFYVALNEEEIVLLHCYKKQSQKAPKKEIQIAEKRMLEVLKDESSDHTKLLH
jgi:phage-related protein